MQGSAPTINADVLFGTPEFPNSASTTMPPNSTVAARSLWFNAAKSNYLSISQFGSSITLGNGLANMGRLITVFSSNGAYGEETSLVGAIPITLADNGSPRTWVIENESEGGLRTRDIVLGANSLIVRGSKATSVNRLFGTGSITVATGLPDNPTHLILNNSSPQWSGALTVLSQAMAVSRSASGQVFGTGANTVQNRGTIAWRSDLNNTTPNTSTTSQGISVTGQGVVRQTGVQRVGAIYNDGGKNRYTSAITFTNHTWFGSRGDLDGYLELSGKITGGNFDFRKVGPGLLILSNPNTGSGANSWRMTIPEGGALRIGHINAMPTGNIRFDGGILELGSGPITFTRKIGSAVNQIRWFQNLDGGFSNFTGGTGATRIVSLNSGNDLTWGQQHFVQDGGALLLNSRYADAPIEFANAISLGTSATGSPREVRVATALTPNAYGVLSGDITSPGSSVQYDGDGNPISFTPPTTSLLKTGEGLLKLTHTIPTGSFEAMLPYLYPLIIRGGALLKPDDQSSPVRLDGGVGDSSGTGGVLGVHQGYVPELGPGTGFNQIQWTGSGGFAGYLPNWQWGQIPTLVIIGSTTTLLEWGVTPHFLGANDELRFGHYTATSPIFFANPIELGPGTKTIRVARGQHDGADAELAQKLSSPNGAILRVIGDGRLDVTAYIDKLRISHLLIAGAEFRLGKSMLSSDYDPYLAASDIIINITNGGTFTLDTMMSNLPNIVHNQTRYSLNAGNINHRSKPVGESYESGYVTLAGGANTIDLYKTILDPLFMPDMRYTLFGLNHDHVSATLNLTSNKKFDTVNADDSVRLQQNHYSGTSVLADYEIGTTGKTIIPWMTVNDSSSSLTSFATSTTIAPGETYIHASTAYSNAATLNNWTANNNLNLVGGTVELNGNKTINSLRIANGGTLNLNQKTLTINSGGLLSTGTGNLTIQTGQITTSNSRPLYLHVYSGLLTFAYTFNIPNSILIKTGPGGLNITNNIQRIHSVYINEGNFNLTGISAMTVDTITVGDGAGTDILLLNATKVNPLKPLIPPLWPKIVLHGTPYDSRGPEYGGPQAILRISNSTTQQLRELHINQRGTIDWVGGEVGLANIPYLDNLTFSGPDAILFMKNWYEYEDRLLVKKGGGFNPDYLQNIIFEGYENFPVIMRKYDWQYWEITPFGTDNKAEYMPEPSTYGAILGTVGLGLWTWRKRRRKTGK